MAPDQIECLKIVAGICAVLGHNYTCWLKFKGGKGIATSAGFILRSRPWRRALRWALDVVFAEALRFGGVHRGGGGVARGGLVD